VQLTAAAAGPPPPPPPAPAALPRPSAPKIYATVPSKASPAPKPAAAAAAASPAAAGAGPDDEIDEPALERLLVGFMIGRAPGSGPVNMPQVGEACLKAGIPMRGRLSKFLAARPHLFQLPDDGRQQVLLVPDAAAAVGIASMAPLPRPAAPRPRAALPSLPDDLLGDGGGGGGGAPSPAPHGHGGGGGGGGGAYRESDYSRWDTMTQAIFQYVRSRGGATFTDIDAHAKTDLTHLMAAGTVAPHNWRSSIFLRKRLNTFRIQGPLVTVAPHAMNMDAGAPPLPPAPAPAPAPAAPLLTPAPAYVAPATAAAEAEAFPPLPSTRGAAAYDDDGASPPRGGAGGGAGAGAGAGSSAELAAERRAFEALRDDIQDRLSAFRALSELQKENAGLRAACVTLGRELLGLKEEFAGVRRQLAAALGPAFAPGAAPAAAPAAAPSAAGGSPPAAPTPGVAESMRSLALGASPNGASSAPGDAAFLSGLAPGPPRGPGEVVLVGGHDGVSWLDAVDAFCPATGAWRSLPAMDRPRSFCAAVASPEGLYIAGGGNGVEWYTSVLRLDPGAAAAGGGGGGAWQRLAPLGVARGSMAAAFACGHLYVYGGGKPGEQYSVVEWCAAARARSCSGRSRPKSRGSWRSSPRCR
jgi:hypothetical protein